jgi:hypothetical protein
MLANQSSGLTKSSRPGGGIYKSSQSGQLSYKDEPARQLGGSFLDWFFVLEFSNLDSSAQYLSFCVGGGGGVRGSASTFYESCLQLCDSHDVIIYLLFLSLFEDNICKVAH